MTPQWSLEPCGRGGSPWRAFTKHLETPTNTLQGQTEGPEYINVNLIKRILSKDKRFTLTVRLNLQNLVDRVDVLKKEGLSSLDVNKVVDRATEILKEIPLVDKKWEKPWWNIDVETPKIRL
jgi:hypothetical protein